MDHQHRRMAEPTLVVAFPRPLESTPCFSLSVVKSSIKKAWVQLPSSPGYGCSYTQPAIDGSIPLIWQVHPFVVFFVCVFKTHAHYFAKSPTNLTSQLY